METEMIRVVCLYSNKSCPSSWLKTFLALASTREFIYYVLCMHTFKAWYQVEHAANVCPTLGCDLPWHANGSQSQWHWDILRPVSHDRDESCPITDCVGSPSTRCNNMCSHGKCWVVAFDHPTEKQNHTKTQNYLSIIYKTFISLSILYII